MKDITCCFTGHRVIPANEYVELQRHLESEMRRLIHQGVRYFGAGGALGFDTMAALATLKLRLEFPHIRLILVLPCKEQAMRWSWEEIETYNQIREEADKIVYTSEHYHRGCMHRRDRHLVDNNGVCIGYVTKTSGGAAYTMNYARQKGLGILNLARFLA